MFTETELKLIIGLCDLALKTNGLQSVNVVVPLASKCQELMAAVTPLQMEDKKATEE